jgi:hypothetical protein
MFRPSRNLTTVCRILRRVTVPPQEHRWLGYENPLPGRFVAICSCGWKSAPYTSAGLAGSASDQHRADVGADDEPDEPGEPNAD